MQFFVLILTIWLWSVGALAQPVEFAILSGTETTSAGDPTNLNGASAAALKWSNSTFDATYFDHSTSSFSHELTIKTSGDYKLSLNVPLDLVDTNSLRRQVVAEVYVNGVAVSHGQAASSYIRQTSGHAESSLSTVVLLESLSVNDTVSVFFIAGAGTGTVTTPGAQMAVQYIDPSKNIFTGRATQTTLGTNLNQGAVGSLQWTESIKDGGFTHSNGVNPQNITLAAGDYMVYVNVPLDASGACNGRNAPRLTVRLGGATITGGSAAQAYIRCADNHDSSSLHWVGLLEGVTGGQVLTFGLQAETSRTDNVTVPAGREASVYIESVNASTEFISLTGTTVLSGANFNPSIESEVQWTSQLAYDATTFTHSTVSNSHLITIASDGDYFLTFNDHMTSGVARPNPETRVKVNGAVQASGVCKTHYMRNADNHNESSCGFTQYLQGLSSGDQISIEHIAEAAGGTVNDASPSRLTLQRVGPSSDPGTCSTIIDCTPDLILHYDGQQLQSIKDDSNRGANDVSFDGTAATWQDVSGSANVHNGTQGGAVNEPTFNTITSGLSFDGTDYFDIANHPDLNTGTLKEKSIVVVFQTGADVTTPQVIYEEGGTVRGMNVYIRGGNLYIAFWNLANDGDGSQAFTSASTAVSANSFYYASLVIDYSNYTGPTGPDGQLRGHINGVAFGSLGTTTSLLYPHGGAIALGAMRNDTYFDTGPQGGNGFQFDGEIYEFLIYNHAIDNTEAVDFYNYLRNKWPDPQPPTSFALAQTYTTDNTQTPLLTWVDSVSPDVNDFQIGIGSSAGATDVQGFTSQGDVTSTNVTGLSLSECVDYYAVIKALDSGLDESTEVNSEFFRYDGTNPSDPSGINITGTASATTSKTFDWTTATDNCSFAGYDVSLGTAAGLTDVVGWTDIGNVANYTFTGIAPNLADATDYFFNIRAKDDAGNLSNVVSSSTWQVDTCVATDVVDPTDPAAFTVVGDAGPTSSPNHTWTASTDACGFSHYEVGIGTSAGATDVVGFTDVGDVLTYKFFGISPSLATNTNYFTTIRAVDLAGNASNQVNTSAWQLASPGGVSNGLVLWLDSNDSGTLFTDNGCSTPATLDNDPIGCWADKSASSNDATATGGVRPTLQLNEFNNQSIVRFDGANDALDYSNINTARTIFVVNKSDTNSFQQILGHTTSQNFYTNNGTLLDNTISSANLRSGSWRVDQANVSSPVTFTQTGSYSLISVVATGNVETDHLASDRKVGGRYFDGDIVEVVIYNRALSGTEVTDVETYLFNKWFTAVPAAVSNLAFATDYSTSSSQSPVFSWDHSSAPDLSYYEVALGTSQGSNNISGWTNIGLVNSHQFLGQSLVECQDIYASVRSVDVDSYVSSFESTNVGAFDGTAPSTPTGLILSGTASLTDSRTLSWSPATDNCSSSTYEIALGTTAGGNDVIDWTSTAATTYEFTGISPDLAYATDYYLSVRSVDLAGNVSTAASSASWQLDSCVPSDVTNPTDPGSLAINGSGTVTRSPTLSWSASTDACSFSHYEVGIGLAAGLDNVVGFTNVGDVGSYQFTQLGSNLAFSTNYFLTVKAVDTAGNESSVMSSSAWQLTSPGNVSPLGMEIWLDAEDNYTLYQDSGCSSTLVTGNGDDVLCMKDKSGNDNHASNSAAINAPEYRASQFNGNPSVYFNGALDEYLTFSSSLSNIRTVFWVIKEDSSNPGSTAFLLGNSAGASFDFHRDSTSGPIFSSANASASVTGGSFQINAVTTDGTTTNMPTSEAVLSLVTTGSVSADSFSQDRTSCCGNRTWGGFASEIIVFNRALSGAEVTNVENYLMLKWGVSSAETQWLGSSGTDWFTPGNWSNGVPDATKSCVIPDQTNDPVINGTGVCRDVTITTGNLTLQAATNSTLSVYGNFTNSGTITFNDGQLEMRDDGLSNTDQTISSTSTIGALTFDKIAGGTVTMNSDLTVSSFDIPSSQFFTFNIPNSRTLTLPGGMTMAGGTMNLQGGGTIDIANAQSISVTGGTFRITGTNDVYPQNTTNKGTITSSGRWGFSAASGTVLLQGFILDRMDVNGFQILGDTDLGQLDGGQFTNLLNDFATPVRALVLNTTTAGTETLASNIGFSFSAANATYSAIATPTDNYLLVDAVNCNNNVIVFDQWFGDYWGVDPNPVLEDKINDTDDGNTCQISMDIAASPVHLTRFSGTPYDQQVFLEWETGSELNHLGFNIYRSNTMYGNYEQINQEVIQNFVNTANFKGLYRYVDSGLTNDQAYYYMIEDIALNGDRELHGPVAAVPMAVLGSAPADSGLPNGNTIADGNDTPNPNIDVTSGDSDVLTETLSGLRVRITPTALGLSDADWNASYKVVSAPGYGKTLVPGEPELLYRRFLVEVERAYTSISSTQVSLNFNSLTASLAGNPITPAPSWALNGSTNLLESSYSPDAATYALNRWFPAQVYTVQSSTIEINGKHFVQVDLWPVRYNPSTADLEQVNQLVLDISLDGAAWDQPAAVSSFMPEPDAVENNLAIRFDKTGVYELEYDDLTSNNVEGPFVGASIASLRLYHKGVEIPLEIESGDGAFDSGDKIRFFARFNESIDSIEDQVVLSLLDLRKEADIDPDYDDPLRIQSVANGYSNHPIASPEYYWNSLSQEQNLYAVFDTPLGAYQDHIYWQRIFTDPGVGFNGNSHHTVTFDLGDLHTSNDQLVKIHVDLRGRGVFAQNPKHNLGLYLNGSGTLYQSRSFEGKQAQRVTFEVPSYVLNSANNDFRFTALGSFVNSGDYDLIDINKVSVEYPSHYKASSDVLHLVDIQPDQAMELSGFSTNQLRVYDVSHRFDSMVYQDVAITQVGAEYLVQFDSSFGQSGFAGKEFFVTSTSGYLSPLSIELTFGSQFYLKDSQFAADYLVVAPHHLLGVLQSLVDHRASQGLNARSVSIEQVYDEYSGGQVSAKALKDFVTDLIVRNKKPRYLLIVGDATYDPKGSLNTYGLSQMPVAIESGDQMDYGSDNYYVELASMVPELSVGRLPSSDELTIRDFINKVISYEAGVGAPTNAKLNAFVSGLDTLNENFVNNIDQLQQSLSSQNAALASQKVNLIDYASDADKKAAIQQSFDQGGLMTIYYGHGAEDMWEDSGVFDGNDALGLSNSSLPIVVTLNCLNSYYYDIDENNKSIGENFIFNNNGGAIAFWGSTSQTSPIAQMNLAQSFMSQIAAATNQPPHDVRLGDLMLQAKQVQGANDYSRDTVRSWTLFGDPALKLPDSAFAPVPQANPNINTGPAQQPAPAASGGGGGGCGAGAAIGNPAHSNPWSNPWVDLLFFLLPIGVTFFLRRRTYSSDKK